MSDKAEKKSLQPNTSNPSVLQTEVHIKPQSPEKKIAVTKQEDSKTSP